jgi:hypothetical protein
MGKEKEDSEKDDFLPIFDEESPHADGTLTKKELSEDHGRDGIITQEELEEANRSSRLAEIKSFIEENFDSQLIQDLQTVQNHLNLKEKIDAISISTRLSALLVHEIQRESKIIVQHKSGIKSELIIRKI